MGVYDSKVELAQRLLTKFGQLVQLQTLSPAAGADPNQPWRPGVNTPTLSSVRGVFLNYEQKYVDGTNVLSGDQQVYLPASAADGTPLPAPDADDLILRGSERWRIIKASPLQPGDTVLLFELQVRR